MGLRVLRKKTAGGSNTVQERKNDTGEKLEEAGKFRLDMRE